MNNSPHAIKNFRARSTNKASTRWSFKKCASNLWSKLAPFLRNVIYKNFQSHSFNINRYTLVSEYARSCIFVFPIVDENYCIAYHITERQWYCPHSKALEHLKACINRINKIYGWEKRKIKNITIILMGNYTRFVNEKQLTSIARRLCRKRGLMDNVRVFVFREEDALEGAAKKIIWFLQRRLTELKKACRDKNVQAYGIVKDRIDILAYLVEGFTLLFTKKLDWLVVERYLAHSTHEE